MGIPVHPCGVSVTQDKRASGGPLENRGGSRIVCSRCVAGSLMRVDGIVTYDDMFETVVQVVARKS